VQQVSNKPFYSHLVPATPSRPIAFRFEHVAPGSYRLQIHKTGYRKNDPLSLYIDMGMPKALDAAQLARMQNASADTAEQNRTVHIGANGTLSVEVLMQSNDVALLTLEPVSR
jgi:xylan 1,4-beta-xylosidase